MSSGSSPTEPSTADIRGRVIWLPGRLVSLDALRGFDMLWILGGDSIGVAMAGLKAGPLAAGVAQQLDHVPWEGFRFYDLIFPLFVFMVGVSIVFSMTRLIAKEGKDQAFQRIVKRGAVLYVLGVLVYNADHHDFVWKTMDDVRLMGVLQRLALCYLITGVLFLLCRLRTLVAIAVAILLGYWALLTFFPAPGRSSVSFAEGQNIVNWVDAHYLPFRKWDGDHDPEGLLSTLPAVASCLLGVFAGLWLVRREVSDRRKLGLLLAAGAGLLVVGYGWGQFSPIIKKLWTPPYVLVAGGWSLLLLGSFFWLIDIRGWQRWARPFIWIGMNPITLYLLVHVMSFDGIASYLVGGPVAAALDARIPGLGGVGISVVGIGLCLALAWFLYLKKLFLRL